ncbi:hypothetical protein ACFWCB_34905 [Streptomyces sp. NPDC060048]|uniref:hypothetical protein n=1 Tax=unclassified Streptomyces TaxID=2593676 RepID=UPI0036C43F23
MNDGLQWIPTAYDTGYTIVFVENRSPSEMFADLGFTAPAIVDLTKGEADQIMMLDDDETVGDLDFVDVEDDGLATLLTTAGFFPRPQSIIRAGHAGTWAYLVESWYSHAASDESLSRISAGTRAVAVHASEAGFTRVTCADKGAVVFSSEPGLPHLSIGRMPDFLQRFDTRTGESVGVALLRFLEEEFGIGISVQSNEEGKLAAVAVPEE